MLDKFKNLNIREVAGLGIAGLFLLAMVMDLAVIEPARRTYRLVCEEADRELKNLEWSLSAVALEPAVKGLFNDVAGLIETAASTEVAVDDMKGQIDDLARRSGLNVASMDHRESIREDGVDRYVVEISQFDSDLKSLLQFLHEIRITPGLFRVERLVVTPDKDKGLIKGSMTLTKLMFPPVAGVADAKGE
ncbi:MAG: hypothetical protein A2498_14200 [Lentisphaerae bacterium RIFOXYC12_FULL_60_16]|nr:MAG: hypothetical protein A2498_14200 [Lentisphaerae bacterium RIFOXYC12_FULL_60_16]OGV72965.1 MAG: hypothetical protein A2269_03340 [Lentisphaerae bacterium RIFOXYA12_FULL_60_10]OGV85157.1 MAG: hypothetical protein A2340_01155 [Lentisphaerae bacterium RIFOXYB12_FULL_60_10]